MNIKIKEIIKRDEKKCALGKEINFLNQHIKRLEQLMLKEVANDKNLEDAIPRLIKFGYAYIKVFDATEWLERVIDQDPAIMHDTTYRKHIDYFKDQLEVQKNISEESDELIDKAFIEEYVENFESILKFLKNQIGLS